MQYRSICRDVSLELVPTAHSTHSIGGASPSSESAVLLQEFVVRLLFSGVGLRSASGWSVLGAVGGKVDEWSRNNVILIWRRSLGEEREFRQTASAAGWSVPTSTPLLVSDRSNLFCVCRSMIHPCAEPLGESHWLNPFPSLGPMRHPPGLGLTGRDDQPSSSELRRGKRGIHT
jgi:hypothetical protein